MNRSRILAAVIAAAVVVGAAVVALVVSNRVDDDPVAYEHSFPSETVDPVWVRIDDDDGTTREVTISWGSLTTTFEHAGDDPTTYTFPLGVGRPEPVALTVAPDASVTFGSGEAQGNVVDIAATPWDIVEPLPGETLPEPVVADDGASVELAVDESYSYGLIVEGVSLRSEPNYTSDRVSLLTHAETYDVSCWVEMEAVTNGNNGDPSDDATQYSSTTWWFVDDDGLNGYVSDVWLGRTDGQTFSLPEC